MSIRKTIFDTMALSSIGVIRLMAQFLAIPLLARILSPEDYGIMAMAMPFLLFTMMIADAGIGTSLVRGSLKNSSEWSTCFWLSVMLGTSLAAIMIISAPLMGMLLEEPKLIPIIMALGVIVCIQSIGSIHYSALQRAEKFKFIAASEIIALLTGIIVVVIVGLYGGGVWALVSQQLAYYIVRILLTLKFSPFKPQRIFNLKDVGEHISFGKDMLGFNLITFLTRSLDNLVIGKILGAAVVGVYSMAFQFARLPIMLVIGPLHAVFYSKMAKVKDDKDSIRKTFLILTRILAITIFPTMGMIAVAHHSIFTTILSSKWDESGRIFMMVAGVSALQAVMNGLCNTVRMVLGYTKHQIRQTIEQGIIWIITMFITIWFGLDYLVISYSVVFILYSPRVLILTLPLINCSYKDYLHAIIIPIIITIACVITFLVIQSLFQPNNIMEIMIAMMLTIIAIAISGLLQYQIFLNEYRVMKASTPQTENLL